MFQMFQLTQCIIFNNLILRTVSVNVLTCRARHIVIREPRVHNYSTGFYFYYYYFFHVLKRFIILFNRSVRVLLATRPKSWRLCLSGTTINKRYLTVSRFCSSFGIRTRNSTWLCRSVVVVVAVHQYEFVFNYYYPLYIKKNKK